MVELTGLKPIEVEEDLDLTPVDIPFRNQDPETVGAFDAADAVPNQDFFGTVFNAVADVESRGDYQAVNPRTGAFGLMQVMKDTARKPGFGAEPIPEEELSKPFNERDPEVWEVLNR